MVYHKPRSKIAKALAFLRTTTPKRGNIVSTADHFHIKRSTLSKAWRKVIEVSQSHSLDSNDREVLRALHLTEPRGASSHRLLSDEQELLVVNKLRSDFPQGFNNRIIKKICLDLFRESRNHPRLFSKHYLKAFRKRAGIFKSKLRIHACTSADQSKTFDNDVEQACIYLETVENLTQSFPPNMFINVDECPSYVRNLPQFGLHFADQPPPWKFVRAKERDTVSVIGAVTGDGHVLHTAVIAKGKTTRCEKQFHSQLPHSFIQHTESGVTTATSFIEYLHHVVLSYSKERPAVLIVDGYKAHLTSKVKRWCAEHHLTLVKVPDRGTSSLQPLDVAVFGAAKTDLYLDCADKVFYIDREEAERWEATAACVEAIDRVNVAVGQRGWKATFPFWNEFLQSYNLV